MGVASPRITKGDKMTVYITQGRYTSAALKGLVAKPEDRLAETKGLIKRGGGKLIDYYITFGEYDFMVIYSAPSPIAAFSIAAVGGAGGSLTDIKTTVAFTSAEAREAYELANKNADAFHSAGT
jgi:uncharacterized protein with GYD domain